MNHNVAAIVLHYNTFDDTKECIDSLIAAGFSESEIYLVDNGSPDSSGEALRSVFVGVRFQRCDRNLGYAAGNNYGVRSALADGFSFLLIVNNDIIVQPGFLQPLLDVLQGDNRCGVVTGKVLYRDSPRVINAAGGRFSKTLCTGVNLRIGEIDDDRSEQREIDFVPGMLVLLKREVVERVGFMDERFFLYFEDLEYSFRMKKYYKMSYTSRSVVFHKSGGGKRGKSYSEAYLYYYTRNRIWFFHQSVFPYRAYVLFFSILSCLHKSMVVVMGRSRDNTEMRIRKVAILWKGLFAGVRGEDAAKCPCSIV